MPFLPHISIKVTAIKKDQQGVYTQNGKIICTETKISTYFAVPLSIRGPVVSVRGLSPSLVTDFVVSESRFELVSVLLLQAARMQVTMAMANSFFI